MKTISDLNEAQIRILQNVAIRAYSTNAYGNGKHDWQSACVAVGEKLQADYGFPNDDAYEVGRDIALDVVSEIEDGTRKCPCSTCQIMDQQDAP